MRVPRSSAAPNHSCLLDTDSCLLELTECPPIARHPTEAGRIRFRNWYQLHAWEICAGSIIWVASRVSSNAARRACACDW
jgi:hypothetical protein